MIIVMTDGTEYKCNKIVFTTSKRLILDDYQRVILTYLIREIKTELPDEVKGIENRIRRES